MNTMAGLLGVSAALVAIGGVPSCSPAPPSAPSGTYQVDTARFVLSDPGPGNAGAVPGVWIDTNIAISGLNGGTVTSSKPYGLGVDYTDNAGTLAKLTFTSIEVVYNDGTREVSVDGLKMPWSVKARNYETVNSMSGGRIVRSRVSLLSGQVRGFIARDEPLALRIEGYFTRKDGGVEPFVIDQRWAVEVEQGTKSAGEVLQDW